jgi:hypothetical protein
VPTAQPVSQAAQPVPTEWDELGQATSFDGDGQDGVFSGPLFGGQEAPASSLLDELRQLPEAAPSPGTDGMAPPATAPGPWSGAAPEKPNPFSWAGSQLDTLADSARDNPLLQSGQGQFARGAVSGLADVAHNLGGSAEALRRGDVLGGIGGALKSALSPGDVFRGAAEEMNVPNQILPQISPETPVLGGLNNPRELAGLIPELMIPETALERGVTGLAGKALGPAARAVRDAVEPAARRVGEVVSPYVDNVLSSIGRGAEGQPAFGMTVGEGGETGFHGSATPFERVDPARFSEDGLYGPGYYKSSDPRLAESYTGEIRGDQPEFNGNAFDWSQDFARRLENTRALEPELVGRGTRIGSYLDELRDDLGQYGRVVTDPSNYDPESWRQSVVVRVSDAFGQDVNDLYGALRRGEITQSAHDSMFRRLSQLENRLQGEAGEAADAFKIEPQANIRKINIPEGGQYLDANKPLPQNEWQQIQNELRRQVEVGNLHPDDLSEFGNRVSDSQRRRIINAGPDDLARPGFNDLLGDDYYDGLRRTFGDKTGANAFLSSAGFDGVTHEGGRIMPLRDAYGRPILHQVFVTFPDKIEKLTNAVSGTPGGIASRVMESPFFSPARTGQQAAADLGLGVAGGVAGAATAPEDATWQERAKRGVAGFALGTMGGPMARAPKGIGGLLREFAENEDGSINFGAVRGRANPPEDIEPEAWRGMSRSERRRANYSRRRGEYAGRAASQEGVPDYSSTSQQPITPADAPTAAADNAYDEVYERQRDRGYGEEEADETAYVASRMREQEVSDAYAAQAERIYDEQPELAPDESPRPKERADEAVARLTEDVSSPTAHREMSERLGAFTSGQEGLDAPGAEGALKKIADTTGSPAAGTEMQQTMEQLDMFDMDAMLNPDRPMPKLRSRTKAAIERGEQVGKDDLPEVQDFAKRMTRAFSYDLQYAHGRTDDAALKEATRLLEPYALDIARTAEPGQGTSAALVALMNRAVEATDTPAKLAYDRWRSAIKRGAPAEETAALERNAKQLLTVNAVYRAGQEVYSSESGRALRANRADVYGGEGMVPRTTGAAVDTGDPARRELKGMAPPRLQARERLEKEWRDRQKAIRKGEADPVSGEGYSWDDEYWQNIRNLQLAGRSGPGASGRSQGGALEREGLFWHDLFIRDDPSFEGTGTKLTENERMRWLYGMEEMGIGTAKFDQFWDRLADINPDDTKAVLQFWNDVAKEGGATTSLVPYKTTGRSGREVTRTAKVEQATTPWERGIKEAAANRALPGRIAQDWEGYLDAAETMPRAKALDLAQRTLKSRSDKAQKALDEATANADQGGIKRYAQAVKTAQKDLNDANGLYARIEREYPPDIKGEASRLQVAARQASDRAARTVSPTERMELQDLADLRQSRVGPAWRREQYQPGNPEGYYDDPVALVRKAQLLQQLDEVNRGAQLTRGALSVATSNMLTSARMVEASAMESAVMMANRLYTQAVWRGDPQGARQMAAGMWAGATPAWSNMVQALRNGMGPMEAMDFLQDVARNQAPAIRSDALRGGLGYLAPMHRISRGLQEFFTTLTYYGELNRLAHVESATRAAGDTVQKVAQHGASAPGANEMVRLGGDTRILQKAAIAPETFFRNPTEAMRKAALQEAADIAAGGPHSAVAKMIANAKSKLETGEYGESGRVAGAALNVFFPFVYGIDFSLRAGLKTLAGPVWYSGRTVEALAKGDTQAAKANAAALGLTFAVDAFLFHQITDGNITGKGPSDPNQRQSLLETVDENGDPVWRPDSMRVPLPNGHHLWMNYTSLPVIGVTGSIMANMWDAYMWDGKKDMTPPERFATLAANTAASIAEGTFFRDTLDLASIMTQPQSAGTALSRMAGSLLSRAIPGSSLLRQVAYASDPNRKTPENLGQEVMQGLPGLRGQVPNQVSPYTGSDVDMNYSWATPFAPGTVYYGQNPQNPVAAEASRLQRQGLSAAPSSYSATQQGRGTSIFEQQQPGSVVRDVQREVAGQTNPRAAAYINSPAYQQLPDADKAAALSELFGGSRDNARFAMQSVPGINLSDQQRLGHAQAGVAHYYGVSGTPEEIERKNREIGQAKSALTEYNRLYGPEMGEIMLRRVSPQAWRLAVLYEDIDPDIRWMRERSAARGAGLNPALTAQAAPPNQTNGAAPLGLQFATPDYAPPLTRAPQTSMGNRLPPSMRR